MAVSAALLLPPEILEKIFNQIDQHEVNREPATTLSAAARVCREWSRSALAVLWRGYCVPSPNICRLHSMNEDGTLPKYLPLIRCLTLRDQGGSRWGLGAPPKPRIRRGCPRHCRAINDHYSFLESDVFYRAESIIQVKIKLLERDIPFHVFHKLLPPNMIKFSFVYPISSSQHLHYLKKYVPNLESLKYAESADIPIVQDKFLDFIDTMPKLRTLCGGVEGLSSTLLQRLEKNTSLRKLRVDPPQESAAHVRSELATYLKGDSSFPFLRKLLINSFSAELADKFLPKFPNLQQFIGELHLGEKLVFPQGFASLKKLENLNINLIFPGRHPPEKKEDAIISGLIGIYSSCASLKDLRVFTFDGHQKFRATAAEFQKACAALPRDIERVQLPLWRDWGRAEIQALARLTRVQAIRLQGIFNLADLQDWPATPTLRSVRRINVNQTQPTKYRPWTLDEVQDIVRPILPNLRWNELS